MSALQLTSTTVQPVDIGTTVVAGGFNMPAGMWPDPVDTLNAISGNSGVRVSANLGPVLIVGALLAAVLLVLLLPKRGG